MIYNLLQVTSWCSSLIGVGRSKYLHCAWVEVYSDIYIILKIFGLKEARSRHMVKFYQHYLATLLLLPQISILHCINLFYNYFSKIPHVIRAIFNQSIYQQVGNWEVYNINFQLLNCNLFRRILWKIILCASLTFHQGISKWLIRQRYSLSKLSLERKVICQNTVQDEEHW